jgi:hypothetical protein
MTVKNNTICYFKWSAMATIVWKFESAGTTELFNFKVKGLINLWLKTQESEQAKEKYLLHK